MVMERLTHKFRETLKDIGNTYHDRSEAKESSKAAMKESQSRHSTVSSSQKSEDSYGPDMSGNDRMNDDFTRGRNRQFDGNVLDYVLHELVARNTTALNQRSTPQERTIFDATSTPKITLKSYIARLIEYAPCSKECYVLALIYVDRIIVNKKYLVTMKNIHRILLTAVMVASKFIDDTHYDNNYFSKVGGVPVKEMNALEIEFLFMIDFCLTTAPEQFDSYYPCIFKEVSSNPSPNSKVLCA